MNKKILNSVCFIILLIFFLIVLSHFFSPKNNMKDFGIHYEKANGILGEKENTIDILVVGDSESYRSIIPLKLWKDYGYTTYICGTPEQRLADSYVFVRKGFKKQKPKIVILEVDNLYIESAPSDPIKNIVFETFPVIEYHDRWKNLNNNDIFKRANYTWTDDVKGYEYSTDVEPANDDEYMTYMEGEDPIQEINIIFVKLISNYCKEHGVKFLLVCAPQTEDWNYARHNTVSKLAKKLDVDFIDMNVLKDKINIDWDTETSDEGVHVNYKGGKKTTKYLGEYLKSLNILQDHREDEKYASWNDALKRFKKITDDDNQGI